MKTIRKLDGICLFSTQEPKDAIECEIGDTIISQMATIVCLRDQRGRPDYYVKRLGLTNTEFELVKNFEEGGRRVLIKQGDNSAIASFDLSVLAGRELKVLSGTPDNCAILDDIMSDVGNDPNDWLDIYYQRAN